MPKYIKKYELTSQKMTLRNGLVLHRIRALRDFACVKKGDLGGWIESESNLATDYNLAWIAGEAKVYGAARVVGDAWISGNAKVYGQALINEEAAVDGNARIYGRAMVSDCAKAGRNARIFGDARIIGNAQIAGNAQVFGNALVSGNALVCDQARIFGKAMVYGYAQVFGNAEICGEAVIKYKERLGCDVKIESIDDFVTIFPIGAEKDVLTLTRCGMAFSVYFGLTWDELLAESGKKGVPKMYRNQYRSAIRFARSFFS